ncbi:MAG: ABC transporter ATP-binding protein [Alphaproteobacteria bacterium]|nr:ABC transporter ATP-binding protein [Alphaproteobacteria bacterium]
MTPLIQLDRLTKRFGAITAVDNVTMTVGSGEVLGFLGPNGAGKSTTMKMVAGFLEPTSGTAAVCGYDVSADPVAVKSHIGYLPEGAPTYGDMTPRAYLGFIAEIRGFDGAEKQRRVDAVVEKVSLENVLLQPIETLSKGFKRRVGLAQAMLHDPPVLIMDEPTDGLDPNQKRHVRALIRDMAMDKAIVISTHILEEVEAVCTRAVIIANGKLRTDAKPEALRAQASNHNAVLLTVAAKDAAAIKAKLEDLSNLQAIETVREDEGLAHLRVVPQPGHQLAAPLGELVRERSLPVQELFVEQGSLDDVFWDMTANGGARIDSDA